MIEIKRDFPETLNEQQEKTLLKYSSAYKALISCEEVELAYNVFEKRNGYIQALEDAGQITAEDAKQIIKFYF